MTLRRLVLSSVACGALGAAALGQPDQSCGNGTWSDNCGNPSIYVDNVRGSAGGMAKRFAWL